MRKEKMIFLLFLLLLGGTAFLGSSPDATGTSVNFLSDRLLPLFGRVIASLELNPSFYPEGTGLNPPADLARWLRKDNRMRDFSNIPLNVNWESLDSAARVKFEALVNEGREVIKYKVRASLSELWKLARANPNLGVTCCGGVCRFNIRFGSRPEISSIELGYGERSNSCVLSWGFPISAWEDVTLDDRRKFGGRHLRDSGCRGNLESLASGDAEAEEELLESYNKVLSILDPIKTYTGSKKEACDL